MIANAIASAVALIKNFMASVTPHLQEIAEGIAQKINEFVESVDWGELGETIHNGIDTALNFLLTILDNLNWDEIGQAVVDFLSALNWGELLQKWSEVVGKAIGGALKGIDLSDALSLGGDIVAGLIKGMLDKWAESGGVLGWIKKALFSPFIEGFKSLFGINFPSTVMAEQGVFLVEGLLQGVSETWGKIVEFFSEKLGALKKTLASQKWESIKTDLGTAWENLKTTAINKFTSIKDKIKEAWENTKTDAASKWEEIKTKLKDTWESVKTDAKDKFANVKQAIIDKMGELKNHDWLSIGTKIMNGIWDGLTSFNSRSGAVVPQVGDYTAVQVSFDPGTTGMEAVNVDSAIKELFTSGSEGKALIASAITAKGVDTAADASFADMEANILTIPSNELPEDVFTITVESSLEDGGTVSGGGAVQSGMTVTVTAKPSENHVFQGWQENGETVSEDVEYTFQVTGGRTLTALFEFKEIRLPEGYTEVEYIQSTGIQYLAMAHSNNKISKIEMDVKPTSTYGFFWGVGSFSSNNNHNFHCAKSASNGAQFLVNGNAATVTGIDTTNQRVLIVWDDINKLAKVNDTKVTFSFSNNYPIGAGYIFYFRKISTGNTTTQQYLSGYLYSYKEYNSENGLIADYVPCVRDSDGKVGCYDLVSDIFHYNMGTGDFIAGPAV